MGSVGFVETFGFVGVGFGFQGAAFFFVCGVVAEGLENGVRDEVFDVSGEVVDFVFALAAAEVGGLAGVDAFEDEDAFELFVVELE